MKTKAQKKKNEKIIQDRTFGLKNKNKSTQVQKYVKGVQNTVKHNGASMTQLEANQYEKKKLKKQKQQQEALLNALYNDVNKLKQESEQEQEDPSSIVCPYFKQGLCQKGKKCIYSHDLTLDRNEEIDLYVDQRTQLIMNAIGGKELSSLSQEELGKLIGQKERDIVKGARSDIVCKHFLQAAQKGKYGWNWTCPNNGDRCKYKHCLPPGYRLKKDAGKMQQQQQINIQQKIDEQRNRLLAENKSSALVTYQIFLKWKESKRIQKEAEGVKKKQEQQKKNKNKGQLRTGRQLFQYDPTLFVDDEEAADGYQIVQEEEIIQEENEQMERDQNDEEGEEGEQGEQNEGQETNENNENQQEKPESS